MSTHISALGAIAIERACCLPYLQRRVSRGASDSGYFKAIVRELEEHQIKMGLLIRLTPIPIGLSYACVLHYPLCFVLRRLSQAVP